MKHWKNSRLAQNKRGCGMVPSGLEYFRASYQNRFVEFSLWKYEIPETVDVIYLDGDQSQGEETAQILFTQLDNIVSIP